MSDHHLTEAIRGFETGLMIGNKPAKAKLLDSDDDYLRVEMGDEVKVVYLLPKSTVSLVAEDWDKFAKPQGLTHGFSDKDFEDLREALFGYRS